MPVSATVLDWMRAFVLQENALYRAAALAEPDEYARVRDTVLSDWIVPGEGIEAWLPHEPTETRQDPEWRAAAAAVGPRVISLVRSYDASGAETHRAYLGPWQSLDPTRVAWFSSLFVRPTAAGLRAVAMYTRCSCQMRGVVDGFLCPRCDGDLWVHLWGPRLDLAALGKVVGVERLIRPSVPAQQADYDTEDGLPPVRGLPPHPSRID